MVGSVPAFRPPWSATVTVREVAQGLLISQPITGVTTPYVSFTSVRFAVPRNPAQDTVQVGLASGADPVSSPADLRARTLFATSAESVSTTNGIEYSRSFTKASQFRPVERFRVFVLVNSGERTSHGQPDRGGGDVILGYDGKSAAVSVMHFWWPWFGALFLVVSALLLSPFSWALQARRVTSIRHAVATHRPLLLLLFVAIALRFVLVVRGGQYFDWDEHRYGDGTTRIFDLLSTGNINTAFDLLLQSPDHPGFRIIGLFPAFFHVVSAWGKGYPISEMRYSSGEWLPAFLFSLASVCSIGLTYALAHRAGASRKESFLAAFLMFSSSAMLINARQLLPYDAAMALLLLAFWIDLKNSGHPFRSGSVGLVAGLAFLTYEGYWLMAVAVGCLHVFRKPLAISAALSRGLLFGTGFATFPALLVVSGMLRDRPFLQGTISFSKSVINGDFSEGWSLPWKYLWNVEHGLLFIYLVGIIMAIYWPRPRARPLQTQNGLMWLGSAATIYLGMIVGSNVLHRFIIYDRTSRQILPFICLAAAAGLSRLGSGRWTGGRRALLLYSVTTLLFLLNAQPLMMQRFPREIVGEVTHKYGYSVRFDNTVLNTSSDTTLFLPLDIDRLKSELSVPKRYVLLNAKDIWIKSGGTGWTPPPRGKVLLRARHPRQLRSMQYQGYTPEQRTFLRSVDFSIRLIDIQGQE